MRPGFCETPRQVPNETTIIKTETICSVRRKEEKRRETDGNLMIHREISEFRDDLKEIHEVYI